MSTKFFKKIESLPLGDSVTFFLGAGFSKAWDGRYPTSEELFTIPETVYNKLSYIPSLLASNSNYDSFESGISFQELREIVYELNMYTKYPDTRPRFIDRNNAFLLMSELKNTILNNFSQFDSPRIQTDENGKFRRKDSLTTEQGKIVSFFQEVFKDHVIHSPTIDSPLRFNFITTNYDSIVEKILDRVFPDHPIFNILYRGITPLYVNQTRAYSRLLPSKYLINLFKINGGFEIYRQTDQYVINYDKSFSQLEQDAPIIMLPSKEQDYVDDYFQQIFQKTVQVLRTTNIL
ncbi:hypothetical protein EHQ27_16065, partial [Leptospira wolffii]